MAPITIEHIRALVARTPRSVLLYDRDGDLKDSGVKRTHDGSLAAGSLARAREIVDELNELVDDGGAGIVAA